MMTSRLDCMVVSRKLAKSRESAKSLILNNQIMVNNICVNKPSYQTNQEDSIVIIGDTLKYVGRGGLKLEKALSFFNINVDNRICMDIGASTGGFTDCMLQNGAQKVYAIDVGHDQLDNKLRNNTKVINLENTNIRNLKKEDIFEQVNFISIDVSFISLKLVIVKAKEFLDENGEIIALIKPQFECGSKYLNKNGILTDKRQHIIVLKDIIEFCSREFAIKGLTSSPIKGGEGNIEYLLYLSVEGAQIANVVDVNRIVDEAFKL